MKKICSWGGLVVAAAMTLVGCAEEIDQPNVDLGAGVPFELTANTVDTKTVNDGLATKWAEGDVLNVFYAEAGATEYGSNCPFTVSDIESGLFTGTLHTALDASKTYDWYALYTAGKPEYTKSPASHDGTGGYNYIGDSRGLNQAEYGSKAHLVGSACPMYAVVKEQAADQPLELSMNHMTSVIELNVTNGTEAPMAINTATIAVPGTDLVGSFYFDITTSPVTLTPVSDKTYDNAKVNVKSPAELAVGESAKLYFVVRPVTIEAGAKWSIQINDTEAVEKTLETSVTFNAGEIHTVNYAYIGADVIQPLSIAEVLEAENNASVLTRGLVVAEATSGCLISDETGYLFVYNSDLEVAVGDMIEISATKTTYKDRAQLENPTTVNVISSGNEVIHPEPVVCSAAESFNALKDATAVQYVEYVGTLNISGYYYNVDVEGTTATVGSLVYPVDAENVKALNGQKIKVTGYYIYLNNNKYINTIYTSIERVPAEWAIRGVNGDWDTDTPMYEIGDWYVAENVALTTATEFKFSKNNWEDNRGGTSSVNVGAVLCSGFNWGNITAFTDGNYDIYLSKDLLYYSLVTAGEAAPVISWGVAGDFNSWGDAVMHDAGDWYVVENVALSGAFKLRLNGTWDCQFGAPEGAENLSGVDTEYSVAYHGGDITSTLPVDAGQTYNVYFKKDLSVIKVTQYSAPDYILFEEFDNTTDSDGSSDLGSDIGNRFPNFINAVKAYTSQFGGIKLGTSSVAGSITTKILDLSKPFKVSLSVKGWTSVEGNIIVSCGDETKTLTYTAVKTDGNYEVVAAEFDAVGSQSSITIATSTNRAYIDDIKVEYR